MYSGMSGSLPSVLRVKQHCCSWDLGSFQSWFRMNSCNTELRREPLPEGKRKKKKTTARNQTEEEEKLLLRSDPLQRAFFSPLHLGL